MIPFRCRAEPECWMVLFADEEAVRPKAATSM
jgi:hypothetical protein